MRIALVGGLERNEAQYTRLASVSGHELESHSGKTGGRGTAELHRLISRASIVIIQITVNSHGGVQMAKRIAKHNNTPTVVIPKLGQHGFKEILNQINMNQERYNRNLNKGHRR